MTLDHDFVYFFPLYSSLLRKREEEKENELSKIVIKGHAFLLDQSNQEIIREIFFQIQQYLFNKSFVNQQKKITLRKLY